MRRLIFLLLLLPTLTSARQPFVHDLWFNESNTPIRVNAIAQDSTGYMWLGTDDGLYRFNGRSFVLIPDSIHDAITAISIIRHKVWVGYKNGQLGQVSGDSVRSVYIRNMAPKSMIRDISFAEGMLLLCSENGIYVVRNHTGFLFNEKAGLSDNFTYCITDMQRDGLLVGTDRGINILRLKDNRITVDTLEAMRGKGIGLPDDIVRVIKRVPGKNIFWVGTQEGGIVNLHCNKSGDPTWINKSVVWKWGQVNDILSISATHCRAVTDRGYLLDVSIKKDSLAISADYLGKPLRKLLYGTAGNIWCATDVGLTMLTSAYASSIKPGPPYSLGNLTSMICDKHGYLWFAENEKLYRISINDTDAKAELMFTAPTAVTCLASDNGFGLWVGTFGKGLYFLKNKTAMPIQNIPNLNNSSILSIADNQRELWVASLNGVEETNIAEPSEGELTYIKHHDKRSGIGSDYVYQLMYDKRGRIWMATDGGGIAMYDGRSYHRWDTSIGIKSKVVYSIAEDANGNIWAGTLNNGLLYYDGNEWKKLGAKDGLQDINISAVAANNTGQVIVVNQKGIDEWYPHDYQFRHLNKRMHIAIDSLSNVLNCYAKDAAGNVYIPYQGGFVVVDNLEKKYDIRPKVQITGISLLAKKVPLTYDYLKYNENYLSFQFDGISYTNIESLHYRYKLKGYNNTWIKTDDESVTYPNLPPGKYTFCVEVSLNQNFDNAYQTNFFFVIATPFWKQRWFIAIALLGILFLVYGYVRLREARLRKLSRLQRERMVFEYEHLKSQVNPHFLFNSLNTLTSLIEEDKQAAIDYTSQLSDLYRHMLAYKDKDLIHLSEEWEILSNYMYIQKSRFGEALQLKVDISDHLMQTKKIVPLSLQIVVENAIKHNIVSLSKPLTIHIQATEEEITIANLLQPKISKEKGAGLGLLNIKKRYSLLSKKEIAYGIKDDQFIVTLPLL